MSHEEKGKKNHLEAARVSKIHWRKQEKGAQCFVTAKRESSRGQTVFEERDAALTSLFSLETCTYFLVLTGNK